MSDNKKSLLGSFASSYGATSPEKKNGAAAAIDEEDPLASTPHRSRAWHKHDSDLITGDHEQPSSFVPLIRTMSSDRAERAAEATAKDGFDEGKRKRPVAATPTENPKGGFAYYIIYAIVNVIISLPGLYGYAAVIFNNPAFSKEMNALSKFVIFSSLVHQLGFLLFSSLNFAIGTVQDAGLIFLSSMSNTIANNILDDGGTKKEVLSTTLVLLSLGTLMLGLVLVLMGHFRLADAVSYLPMPVVGGYLAFIGFFCLQAGVGLCISESIMTPRDWAYLLDPENILLATPGLLSGLLMTIVSRKVDSDAALPALMVLIPAVFYIVIFSTGIGMEGAREGNWVGQVSDPVPVSEMLALIDFRLVRWGLIRKILPTWAGMIFVVSFASCLDVAAISLDMGEALDTNRELATVGLCNVMSGFTFGYTGSYIFSQTIFTYRTGVHSKWIGFFIMVVFFYVTVSPMNVLQMAPLFFFGATLIFIGYDLLYEWLIEIRHKIFLSEYAIVWATFIAIQVVGIDVGIVLGVLVAIVNHVVATAQISGVHRVAKQSRAVWTPKDYKLLHAHGYHPLRPKIVTLEIVGTVFFGSSLQLLERISEEIGLNIQQEEFDQDALLKSPHRTSYQISTDIRDRRQSFREIQPAKATVLRCQPQFVVLDLTLVPNLDASASRGCFLQLAKACAKKNIVVCAAGATPRVEWMLRSHDVAYDMEEEARVEAKLQARADTPGRLREAVTCDRVLLFLTIHEALEFCENVLIHELNADRVGKSPSFIRLDQYSPEFADENAITTIISHMLGLEQDERKVLRALEDERYHEEITFKAGQLVINKDTYPGAFYVVLKGSVAVTTSGVKNRKIVSGAGPVQHQSRASAMLDPSLKMNDDALLSIWPVGGVFGYVDYILERPRRFKAVAAQDGTICAKFSRSQMLLLRSENPELDGIMQRVLLRASIMDLAGCSCRD
jgi:SulP family sulfate permease